MPITIDPTVPADGESPRQGASRIRSLTLELLGLFSQAGGSAVTFANAPFSVDTSGNVTVSTTLTVPVPASSTQAAQLASVSSFAASAPTVSKVFVNPTIAFNSFATVFQVTSTPPGTTQLYRALVSTTVFAHPSSVNFAQLLIWLTDSASLFSNPAGPSAQANPPSSLANNQVCANFTAISNGTATGNGGAVTFTITGFATLNTGIGNLTLDSQSHFGSAAPSYVSIAWLPAQ